MIGELTARAERLAARAEDLAAQNERLAARVEDLERQVRPGLFHVVPAAVVGQPV